MGKSESGIIVFYNPHVDDFLAEPPHYRLLRRRALKKYGYILEGELQKSNIINVYCDGTCSVFLPQSIFTKLPKWIRSWIASVEFDIWVRKNKLVGKVRKVHRGGKTDVLLAFSYKAARGLFLERLEVFEQFRCCIMHLSHYFVATSEKATNLSLIKNLVLAGDSDISDNPYFKKYFAWYSGKVLLIPFAIGDRFVKKVDFYKRRKRVVSTGTFHDLAQERPISNYIDFRSFFDISTYHPARKMVFEKRNELNDIMDCHVNYYRPRREGIWRSLVGRFRVSQKQYFKIDLVALYNDYQIVHVGEELSGFPGIGAFEGMACGALLVGQEQYYRGLGLAPGTHYLPYDGSEAGLRDVFNFVVENPERAAVTASAGNNWAANLRPKKLIENFYGNIEHIMSEIPSINVKTNSYI